MLYAVEGASASGSSAKANPVFMEKAKSGASVSPFSPKAGAEPRSGRSPAGRRSSESHLGRTGERTWSPGESKRRTLCAPASCMRLGFAAYSDVAAACPYPRGMCVTVARRAGAIASRRPCAAAAAAATATTAAAPRPSLPLPPRVPACAWARRPLTAPSRRRGPCRRAPCSHPSPRSATPCGRPCPRTHPRTPCARSRCMTSCGTAPCRPWRGSLTSCRRRATRAAASSPLRASPLRRRVPRPDRSTSLCVPCAATHVHTTRCLPCVAVYLALATVLLV